LLEEVTLIENINPNDEYTGVYIEWHDNGQKLRTGYWFNGKRVGLHSEWYSNGQIKRSGHWIIGYKNAIHEEWHENGIMFKKGEWKNGKRIGLHEEWFFNGKYSKCGYWNNGKDGKHQAWYFTDNGADSGNDLLQYTKFYIDGKKNGLFCSWNKNGNRTKVNYWIDDKIFICKDINFQNDNDDDDDDDDDNICYCFD
jgi:antitoxin component YwqK of YwqJK toxin-antitoxin module